MGKKRSGEQALRDDWEKADKAVSEARVRLEAISITRLNVNKAFEAQKLVLKDAADRRDRITAALEALIGKEVSDGESAAPATTGADAEVQPDQQGEPEK